MAWQFPKMTRRSFLKNTSLGAVGAVFAACGQVLSFRQQTSANLEKQQQCDRRAFLRRLMPAPKDGTL